MLHFCKKHRNLMGCIVALVLFVVLHFAVPAGVALGVASHAHSLERNTSAPTIRQVQSIQLDDGVVIHQISLEKKTAVGNFLYLETCLVGVAKGKMAKTLVMECID